MTPTLWKPAIFFLVGCLCHNSGHVLAAERATTDVPADVQGFLEQLCLDCHSSGAAEAGLDLESLEFDLGDQATFDRWVLIHDRVRDGEMPPPDDGMPSPRVPVGWSSLAKNHGSANLSAAERMLSQLADRLIAADHQRVAASGRAKVRRLNRYEYENALRQALDAPWLQIADMLPEDGLEHLFNKVGERLDVSHVQMQRYLAASDHAIRMAVNAAAHPSQKHRYYAREEPVLQNYLHYRFGQRSATRSIVPLVGTTPEPDVIRKLQPITVGEADPDKREQEAMGVFCGVYSATTKYDFTRIDAPTDGNYRLRFKTYTFMAGPNGASGGDDHGLTGGDRKWWRPDRSIAFPGQRSEPITLYALASSGDSRWLTTFDSHPEPSVFECVVSLRQGEGIRPDAGRLVRTRPGWDGNPNASEQGVPGFAMHWLEVEGPLQESWPPASYRAIFGDLPFQVTDQGQVQVQSDDPDGDARRLLKSFYARLIQTDVAEDAGVEPFVDLYHTARSLDQDFPDAMISSATAIFCSPQFLYLDAHPGPLSDYALHQRLAYFLWNGPPEWERTGRAVSPDGTSAKADVASSAASSPPDKQASANSKLYATVEAMLEDPRSDRFIHALLDYWLDLRDINANTPDAELYPDYYLDELLTESSLRETRWFLRELIDRDLPVRNLVAADFAMVNERLARHYDLPAVEGVQPRRVALPEDSPRGGLLTQASLLRVTANGTTTSPVVRGAWIMERIMGVDIPSPPSGVAAVEPDIRGATTIREQLAKHRSNESCNACHARFDPAGFALESFDVAGGWRDRYRAMGEEGEPVEGLGKNGHAFRFRLAQPVDCAGTLIDGEQFADIRELKHLLASRERQLARNFLHRLIVYATGAPVSFGDRGEVERMLDRAQSSDWGVRTLIHQLVESKLFQNK